MLAPAPEAELPRRAESAALNSNRPSALRAEVTSEASVPTPPFYPALRRRKLRIAHFRRKRRKIACSAAPPFPTAPALLGCGGSPDCPRRMWENRPQRVQRGAFRPGMGTSRVRSESSTRGRTGGLQGQFVFFIILRHFESRSSLRPSLPPWTAPSRLRHSHRPAVIYFCHFVQIPKIPSALLHLPSEYGRGLSARSLPALGIAAEGNYIMHI